MAINHRVAINHCASAPACQRRGQWRLQGFVGGGEGMGGGGSALAESFALTFQLHSGESSGFSSGMGGNGSCPRGNLDPIPPPPLALGESLTSLAAARPLLGTAPPSSWSVSSASVPLQQDGMFLPPPPQPPRGLFPPSQPPQSSSEAHTQWVVSVLSTGSIHSRQHGDSGFIHVGTESGGRNGWAWAGGLGGGEREGGRDRTRSLLTPGWGFPSLLWEAPLRAHPAFLQPLTTALLMLPTVGRAQSTPSAPHPWGGVSGAHPLT